MFWNNFLVLCNEHNTTPTSVVKELKISNGSVTHWKNGKVPHHGTLLKIADYFGVSIEYLLGNVSIDLQHFASDQKEEEPTVTIDPKLLSLIDSMTEDELADLEKYAEFILSKKNNK